MQTLTCIRDGIKVVAFNKFDSHPDFVSSNTFLDVDPHSQTTGHQRTSRMDYIHDNIANSLMRQ
jgi:hypothetical protein